MPKRSTKGTLRVHAGCLEISRSQWIGDGRWPILNERLRLPSRRRASGLSLWAFILPLLACSLFFCSCETQKTEVAPLRGLVDRYIHERATLDPQWATTVGLHDRDGESRDLTAAGFQEWASMHRRVLQELRSLQRGQWFLPDEIDRALLEILCENEIRTVERGNWKREPSLYLPFQGVRLLLTDTQGPRDERLRAAALRLLAFPQAIAAGKSNLQHPPRLWTEMAIRSAGRILRYLNNTVPEVAQEADPGTTASLMSSLRVAGEAIGDFQRFLEVELLSRSDGSWVVGSDEYNWLLERVHLLPYNANELITVGWQMLDEMERRLERFARKSDPDISWQALTEKIKERHPVEGLILSAYEGEARRALELIQQRGLFDLPPGERLEVIETPPHLRDTYPYGGYDGPAPFEKNHVGRFFVTPVEPTMTLEERKAKLRGHNYGWITVVALHETYPGHHLQFVKAFQNDRPLRKIFDDTYFIEGWALYAEELMGHYGFYESFDAQFTQLRMKLWRAARVVIDPSIHTGQMTYDEAVRLLQDRVGLEEANAKAEVNRYTTWPTQAPSYLIGMRFVRAMRTRLETDLGEQFDEKAFHEALLMNGALPLPLAWKGLTADFPSLPSEPPPDWLLQDGGR